MGGTELARHPGALPNLLRFRRQASRSLREKTFWDGKITPHYAYGEPRSAPRTELLEDVDVMGHLMITPQHIVPQERMVYSSRLDIQPAIGEKMRAAGITREAVDPHVLLDNPRATREEKLSEALRRERQGKSLTRRWAGYLLHMRAYFAADHSLAFKADE